MLRQSPNVSELMEISKHHISKVIWSYDKLRGKEMTARKNKGTERSIKVKWLDQTEDVD